MLASSCISFITDLLKSVKRLSLSPLMGSRFLNLLKILTEDKFRPIIYLSLIPVVLIVFILEILRLPIYVKNRIGIKRDVQNSDVIFIIGFWRSGTTHLHNLLCQDSQVLFLNTYRSVFPDVILFDSCMKWIFSIIMPRKRFSDNMELNADLPQEEEFAILNRNGISFYRSFYLPTKMIQYFKRYILLENKKELTKWSSDYNTILGKLIKKDKIVILKNPCNTGRVNSLLKLYPSAKFIYIYRNPFEVLVSARKMFLETTNRLCLEPVEEDEIGISLIEIYGDIIDKYEEDKRLIPKENLIEVKFEELEEDPKRIIEKVYNQFQIPDARKTEVHNSNYIRRAYDYNKMKYSVKGEFAQLIRTRLDKYFSHYGYQ